MIQATVIIEVFKYLAVVVVILVLVGQISSYFDDSSQDILTEAYNDVLDVSPGLNNQRWLDTGGQIPRGAALLFFNEGKDISIEPSSEQISVATFEQPQEGCAGSMCICYCGRVNIEGESAACMEDTLECREISEYSVNESTNIATLYPPAFTTNHESCLQLGEGQDIRDFSFKNGVVLYNPVTAPRIEFGEDNVEEQCRQNLGPAVLGYKYDVFTNRPSRISILKEESTVYIGGIPSDYESESNIPTRPPT